MSDAILQQAPLGFVWKTADPFLFCVHHEDHYPAGNDKLGPAASLAGRNLGQDFELKDGWRMYHGREVPGFPQHPHRGFETVTLVRDGFIDHTDSLGAAARFGNGDVQWLTAGRGIVHCEMFPLLDPDGPNRCELFQIWLNLPATHKMVDPHFTMMWAPDIPTVHHQDDDGARTRVTIIAGQLGDARPPSPPPHSWASTAGSDVAIWTIAMDAGARWTLPAAQPGTNRSLFFFSGGSLRIDGKKIPAGTGLQLRPDAPLLLTNGPQPSELLMLQGRPIGEPVVQHGPFVMNSAREIQQAFADYQRTRFGGWPWPDDAPVHGRERSRFARHADGRVEER